MILYQTPLLDFNKIFIICSLIFQLPLPMSTSKKTQKAGKIKQFNFIPYNPHGSPLETPAKTGANTDLEIWNEPTTWIFLQIVLGIHLKLKHANPKCKNEIWKHALDLFNEELVSQKAATEPFVKSLTVEKLQEKWDTLRNQYFESRRDNTRFIYYEEIEQICKYDPEIVLEADANGSVYIPEIDFERDEKLADERCKKNNVKRIPAYIIHTRILEPSDAEYSSYGTYTAAQPKSRPILPTPPQNKAFDDETEMLSTCIRGFFQHAEGVSIQMMRAYREDMKQSLQRMEQLFEENTRKRKAELIEVLEVYEQRRRIEQEEMFKRIEKMYKENKTQ